MYKWQQLKLYTQARHSFSLTESIPQTIDCGGAERKVSKIQMALNWMSGGNRSEESDLPPTPTATNGSAPIPASNGAAIHGETKIHRAPKMRLFGIFSILCI